MTDAHTLAKFEAADFINRTYKSIPRSYGDALFAAAKKDPRIVALTADLATPTETDLFRDELPERYHNVGIAEANMIGLASGMARTGEIPSSTPSAPSRRSVATTKSPCRPPIRTFRSRS